MINDTMVSILNSLFQRKLMPKDRPAYKYTLNPTFDPNLRSIIRVLSDFNIKMEEGSILKDNECSIYYILMHMINAGLLDQENFALVLQHPYLSGLNSVMSELLKADVLSTDNFKSLTVISPAILEELTFQFQEKGYFPICNKKMLIGS